MIVVDTNILVYATMMDGQYPDVSKLLRVDDDWAAPRLWRSEYLNVLAGAMAPVPE